jgi:hypothetical protein
MLPKKKKKEKKVLQPAGVSKSVAHALLIPTLHPNKAWKNKILLPSHPIITFKSITFLNTHNAKL